MNRKLCILSLGSVLAPCAFAQTAPVDRAEILGELAQGRNVVENPERPPVRADDDIVIEQSGATVLIDPVSLNYMAGSEIDFVDDLIGSSFKVNNPKATASCGCGTSFAL